MPISGSELQAKIAQAKIDNAGLTPCINTDYWCETCGSTTGESHPDTSYCFICDSDDWYPTDPLNR